MVDEEVPMKPPKEIKKSKQQEKRRQQDSERLLENEERKGTTPNQKRPQQRQRTEESTATPYFENPLLDAHSEFMATRCTAQERDNFFSNTIVSPDRRGELWMEQADRGEELVNQYSWAIPDARAVRILKYFSPLVEIGCGSNAYWSRLLATQAGVDIVAYDMFPEVGGQIMESSDRKNKNSKGKKKNGTAKSQQRDSFQVLRGGPEVLASKKVRDAKRTLFLCYSDEEVLQPTANEKSPLGQVFLCPSSTPILAAARASPSGTSAP